MNKFLAAVLTAGMIIATGHQAGAIPGILAPDITAGQRDMTQDERLSDFSFLVQLIKSNYGPLQYKAKVINLNFDAHVAKYETLIRNSQNNADFYYLINQFVAEFRDSHFSSRLPSNYVASLPFSTDLVAGKVVIDRVNRTLLPITQFPFDRGDEIVTFDGQPVEQLLQNIAHYRGAGFEGTAKRSAAMSVTSRRGMFLPVPSGNAKIQIRSARTNKMTDVTLPWINSGTPVDEAAPQMQAQELRNFVNNNDFDHLSIMDVVADLQHPNLEPGFMCSGATRTKIPDDATIIMKTPIVAYYHPTPKGNVGYLRIPEYMAYNATGQSEFDVRFAQYEYAISVLEKNTIGLVIDQQHNCGGSVDFLHRVVSLLVTEPFETQRFELRATKSEYLKFMGWVNQTPENSLDRVRTKTVADLIRQSWAQGMFLTPKTPLDGVAKRTPNDEHYSKPILILIDEMSGSGGDAFPALMQGIGRAKLLGTRTMGAGGHVQPMAPLPFSGITVNMTRSLFYRPDGVAVENNGAVPDIPYEMTMNDFMNGYQDFQKFYVRKLLEML